MSNDLDRYLDAMLEDEYEREQAGSSWPPIPKPGPLDVIFTQYLRPHGHTREVWTQVPEDVKRLADELTAQGYRFECEELTTGHASLTVEHPRERDEPPLAHEVVPNDPGLVPAVERLIRNAHQRIIQGKEK